MLTVSDLPGSGWRPYGTDSFNDGDFGDIALRKNTFESCGRMTETTRAVRPLCESARAGRAQAAFASESVTVETIVTVYDQTDTATTIFEAARQSLVSNELADCFQELFNEGAGEGKEIRSAKVDAVDVQARAPNGGTGKAVTVSAKGVAGEVVPLFEWYVWRQGNATVTVVVSGLRDEVSPDLASAAIARTKEKLDAQGDGR